MIDFILLIVFGLITWCVSGEGAFGAAVTCICVILAGLLSMNFYEPAAAMGEGIASNGSWAYRWDMIAMLGLFSVFTLLLRFATTNLAKLYIQMSNLTHEICRWLFGAITGYVVMAFCLTALHTAPFPRDMTSLGFTPERRNLFDVVAPDRQWLGFTQYASESVFGGNDRYFDGPVSDFIEGPNDENTVWPSFPIRYASRRDELSGAFFGTGRTTSGPTQQPNQQQPIRRQQGGGAGF
jgi:hypothetical protein